MSGFRISLAVSLALAALLSLSSCLGTMKAKVSKSPWGKTKDGQDVSLYTLENAGGVVAKLTDYGAILVSLDVPDRTGQNANVVLGFDSVDKYIADTPYFGATVGRYCNRIGKGKFSLDGKEYTLATNNGANHLHGCLLYTSPSPRDPE